MSFFGLMTVKAHEAAVAHYKSLFEKRCDIISDRDLTIGRLEAEAQQERETAGRLLGKNVWLRSEVAALSAELDHWRKHGQLRDPATGRLIPRVKKEAA